MDKDKKRNGFTQLVAGFIIVELVKACMNTVAASETSNGGYGRAMKGIADSDMSSWDKSIATKHIPLDITPDQADGVCAIAGSTMDSWDKSIAIKNMFK